MQMKGFFSVFTGAKFPAHPSTRLSGVVAFESGGRKTIADGCFSPDMRFLEVFIGLNVAFGGWIQCGSYFGREIVESQPVFWKSTT